MQLSINDYSGSGAWDLWLNLCLVLSFAMAQQYWYEPVSSIVMDSSMCCMHTN